MTSRRLSLVVLVLLGACSRHGAAGVDTTVSGTWTVEGAAPTTTSCADVGIDTVRLGIYGPAGLEYIAALEAPCTAGMIDTRPTPVLAAGVYDVAWEGFRGGERVAQGSRHQLVASAGSHAVVPVVDFVSGYDPTGTDASVSARWTIDGVAPSASACIALGVSRVRIAAFHGSQVVEIAELTSTCGTGTIDTRPRPVLAAGDVVLQLQALDAHQGVLFSGAMVMVHVPGGPAHVSLYDDVPVDFAAGVFDPHGSDATASFGWTLDHQAATLDSCDAVGATTVALVLYAPDDSARAHGVSIAEAPCHLGSFDSGTTDIVRAGAYLASVEARDPGGHALASTSPSDTPFAVTAGTRFAVPTVDLSFPTTLTVSLDWADRATGAGTTCAGAGITSMGYSLIDRATTTTIEQRGAVPCAERLEFDATRTPGFVAGSYDLRITGTDGSHAWATGATECTAIDVPDGGIAWTACFVASP